MFEQLEDRRLLDGGLANAALSSVQRQTLLDGLQGVATWTDTLSSFNKIGQPLTVVGKSVGETLAARSILESRLINPLVATPASTTDIVVTALKGLSSSAPGLTVTVNPASVTGGLLSTPQGDELQFNLVFDAVRTNQVAIDLGSNVINAGLNLDPAFLATRNANLHFAFTFGFDLTPGLNAAEAFFVRVNSLTLGESIHEAKLSTPAKVGLLGAQVQGGTLDLAGAVSVILVNPDADAKGNITLAELQNTNISALAGISTTANSLSGTFPIVASLGTTTFAGSPLASISSTNVFAGTAPDITGNAGFQEIQNFNNLSTGNLLTVLDRVASGLQDLAPSLDVNTVLGGIPYVNAQPSAVADFNSLVGGVSRGLYDPVLTAHGPLNLAPGGRLSDNAVFSLNINGNSTTAVTLLAAGQSVYETIDAYFNRSLPLALLGKITASQVSTPQGTFFSLKAIDPAITSLEILISDRANPITTNLGFEPSQASSPVFKFDTVQTFVPVLAQLSEDTTIRATTCRPWKPMIPPPRRPRGCSWPICPALDPVFPRPPSPTGGSMPWEDTTMSIT